MEAFALEFALTLAVASLAICMAWFFIQAAVKTFRAFRSLASLLGRLIGGCLD